MREAILHDYRGRMEARGWADARMNKRAAATRSARKWRDLDARIGKKLAQHVGVPTEDEIMAMTWEDIERRWEKLPSQDVAALLKEAKTLKKPGLPKYRRAKGYRDAIIQELADKYKLKPSLIADIVDGK
jgi:hypothetical protein